MQYRFPRFVSSSDQPNTITTNLQHHCWRQSHAGVRAASAVLPSGHPSSSAMTVPQNCPFKATFLLLVRDGTRNSAGHQQPWRGNRSQVSVLAEPWRTSQWEPAWITWVCERVGQKDGQHCSSVTLSCVMSIYGKPPKCWETWCFLHGNWHSKQVLQRQSPTMVVLPFWDNEGSVFAQELGVSFQASPGRWATLHVHLPFWPFPAGWAHTHVGSLSQRQPGHNCLQIWKEQASDDHICASSKLATSARQAFC